MFQNVSGIIPTDNLYKFMAITGIIGFLFSVIYAEFSSQFLQKQMIDVEYESEAIKAKSDALDRTSKRINSLTEKEVRSFDDSNNKFRLELVSFERKIALLKQENEHVFVQRFLCIIVTAVSILMMSVGFGLWYFKIQRYEDMILKNKLNS